MKTREDRNKLANLKFSELEQSYLKMMKLPLNTMKLTLNCETNTIQTTKKNPTIGTTLHTRRVINRNFKGPVLDNDSTKPAFY